MRICFYLSPSLPPSLLPRSNHPVLGSHKESRTSHSFPQETGYSALGCKCDRAGSFARNRAQFPGRFAPKKDCPNKPLQENRLIPVSRDECISVTHSKSTFHQGVGQALPSSNLGSTQWTHTLNKGGEGVRGLIFQMVTFQVPSPQERGPRTAPSRQASWVQSRQDSRSASRVRLYVVISSNARRYSFPETHSQQELEADSVFPRGLVFLTSCQTRRWRPWAHCQWVTSSPRRSDSSFWRDLPSVWPAQTSRGCVQACGVCVRERERIIL